MLPLLLTALALSGTSSAASSTSFSGSSTSTGPTTTSTEISFAFVYDSPDIYVPTSGVSGKVWNVTSSTTTMVFHCPSGSAKSSSNDTAGVLCAAGDDGGPVAVEFGDDYWSMGFVQPLGTDAFAPQTTLAEPVTAGYEMHCDITGSKTSASPVCTVNVTSVPAAVKTADLMALDRCWEEDVAGPRSEVDEGTYNTASITSCMSSVSADPTTAYTVTRNPTNVKYWTVTVTEVAAGVTLEPSNAAPGSLSVRLSAAAVVGFAIILAVAL
ncbi:hypothetical protein BFW01_g2618 [Lasiodiplodia theobromae]|uniref:Uncharacterized protein n=1 Tax=Lasiodiplodia theobromae TaxID=45133 RepID=A0A5N5DG45_9PEZI|nr:hypothetical protein DBV05_g5446 [Lasiodiplodia theobromae]KAF9631756.1 hypothetical protein BFW01_g2618 [Lasiodiplodia theobromae]